MLSRYMMKYEDGCVLLHHILIDDNYNTISSDIMLYIINLYPDAVHMKDDFGNLTIHLVCKNKCRHNIISKLLNIYPDSSRMKNQSNKYPLYCALSNDKSKSNTIIYLINLYPDAVHIGKYFDHP